MFDKQPSENKSAQNMGIEQPQQDDVPIATLVLDSEKELSGNEQQDDEHIREEMSPRHSHSAAQDTEVTDEKLFLESTGFGEPKHRTQDFEEKEENSAVDEDQLNALEEPINIAVLTAKMNSPVIEKESNGDALDVADQDQ